MGIFYVRPAEALILLALSSSVCGALIHVGEIPALFMLQSTINRVHRTLVLHRTTWGRSLLRNRTIPR